MPIARSTEVDSLGVINLIGSNLMDRYSARSILKELLQNADDAGAKTVIVGWTASTGGNPSHELLRGPALFVVNDGKFTERDADAINRFGQNYKSGEKSVIGKFGLGLKSVFHLSEAFFYLSSAPPDDDGLFNNLASPWANTEFHRGWNDIQVEDLKVLHDFLRPICSPLRDDWFALWLPLRRSVYSQTARFGARLDGDQATCPPELLNGLKERGISRSLPLLHSVSTIRIWRETSSLANITEIRLAPKAGRSLFKDYLTYVEALEKSGGVTSRFDEFYGWDQRCLTGYYESEESSVTTKVPYALVQSWSTELLELTKQDDWPKSFVISGGQRPDKAQPHGAVVLSHRSTQNDGRLDVTAAVFLPLESDDIEASNQHLSECEFLLSLHGCFFVDSGRNAPYVGQGVRDTWNRRLMSEGVLPLLVSAIEALAKSGSCDSESILRLTRAVAGWLENPASAPNLVGGKAREKVCRTSSWACRWFPEGMRWEAFDSTKTLLEIPDHAGDSSLPLRVMPALGEIAREFVLTPFGYPHLTLNGAAGWDEAILARVLVIDDPEPLFEDNGSGLLYLCNFLDQHPPIHPKTIAALMSSVRKIFASIRASSLDEHRDALIRVVSRIPASFRRGLPLGGNWPDETRRAVCAVGSQILLLPGGYDPASNPGTGSIITDDAVELLYLLAGSMTPGRNTNPAAAVIRASVDPQKVVERTVGLRLWTGQRLDSSGMESVLCTVEQIQLCQARQAVFIGPVNDWLRDLSTVLVTDVIILPRETAEALFYSNSIPQGDMPGVLAHLVPGPPIGDIAVRATLLRRLVSLFPNVEQDRDWRWVVRYLLHGNSDLSGDSVLFLSGSDGVWNRLAVATLSAAAEAHRILPHNELSGLLNAEQRTRLGIQTLDQNGIAGLLSEVDLKLLSLHFSKQERDEILRGLQQYPALIRDLPLHDLHDGSMTRITANCYWLGDCSPGTVARYVTLLRNHYDPVLAAIQKNAYSKELTPVELVRLALQNNPAEHADAILGVFARYRELAKEARGLLDGLQKQLADAEWLPIQEDRRIAPANVLHDERLGGAIVDAIRMVRAVSGDPVSSTELAADVRQHAGFREMARQLCPSFEQLVSRIAQIVKRDSLFVIGGVDIRTESERNEWLEAFRDAPADVMVARGLIKAVDAVDTEVCVSRLLPPLREGSISPERFERILTFLRDHHERGLGRGPVILRTHNEYLRLAAANVEICKRLLPRLRLLSETWKWANPNELCDAQGVDQSKTLCEEHQQLLRQCIARQSFMDKPHDGTSDESAADCLSDLDFDESVRRLCEYFQSWRDSEETAGWAGAFLSLLGDYEPIQKLANEYLGIASPGLTFQSARRDSGMQDAYRPARSTKPETPSVMMKQQRVLFRFADPSRPLEVVDLLGSRMTVDVRPEFDHLFIGYGMDYREKRGDLHVRHLHLRLMDAVKFPRIKLQELVKRTGELVLRDFYGQEESNITFGEVLQVFSGDDAFGIRVAQESFLSGAQYSLPFLGLRSTQNEQLRDLLKLADSAASRRAEENAMPDKPLPGERAQSLERVFREDLQNLISSNATVQDEMVAAVQRKLREFRYEPRSVLFELFQNADDACVEAGSTSGEAIFLFQKDGDSLLVFHNGRPINRSPGSNESTGYLHDLRKMLSLGHSDKGSGPAAGEVTGRFGLGFKSVFLVTNRPRIASGRLAFEVLGGVYPKPVESRLADGLRERLEHVGLSRESGTIFELQSRSNSVIQGAVEPFYALAHMFVVFARRIRSIRCGEETATWTERTVLTTDHARIVLGELRPLGESTNQQAFVIRCKEHGELLFCLDDSGFIGIEDDVPSIWVTAPTTEHHDVGYLVNAPLDLDVGRCQVTWDSDANGERLHNLGQASGDVLIALFDAGIDTLGIRVNWQSFWDVVKARGIRHELRDRLMWGEHGAARRLYEKCKALPTGLKSTFYFAFTSLTDVKGKITGVISQHLDVFLHVSGWESFQQAYPQGSLVDESIGKFLPNRLPSVTLVDAIRIEFEKPRIDPQRATEFGHTITRESLNNWHDRSLEVEQLRELLKTAQFRNENNHYVQAGELVAIGAGGDEAMRATFAPPDRLLSEDYKESAVVFFLACRGPMIADTETLVEWMFHADTEECRNAALRYLERGELGTQVRRELYQRGICETWLGNLSKEEMEAAGLNEYEQSIIRAGLGQANAQPTPPLHPAPLPPPQPQIMFQRIAAWWMQHSTRLLRKYNARIYPDGSMPSLRADELLSNTTVRIEWLRLFTTGVVQTIGRVTPDQNRTFIKLCGAEDWFKTLSDSVDGPHEWLTAVERYIDDHHADGIRYFHWLRHFVSIATVARHLDAYTQAFMAIDRFEGQFTVRDVMTTRTSRQFQFGGPDAPTLVPILGIGACFILRELVRMEVVNREDVYPYCFAPVKRLREFLGRLGWRDDKKASVHDRSRSIYEFIFEHFPSDPTFGCSFDIPLLMYAEEHPEAINSGSSQNSGDWVTLSDGRRVPLR